MKKILAFFLIFALSFACMACEPEPEPVDENPQGLKFFQKDDGTYVVSCGDAAYRSNIVIPATYKGAAVVALANDAFSGCTLLESITLPESITKIGDNAFSGCTLLATLNYEGTWQQWNNISLGSNWYAGSKLRKIDCSNDVIYFDITDFPR